LEAENGHLKVFATDLEVSITDLVPAQVHTPGRVATSAKSLFDIAKELSDGPVTITRKDNNWVEIHQNKYVSKIVGISHEEYPVFPTVNGTHWFEVQSEVLKEMIDKTIYSVSNDETRYHLNGVFFERISVADQIQLRMVATDGHRLSLVDRNTSEKGNGQDKIGVIIPRKGLSEIRKLLETRGGRYEMAIEGTQLVVRNETTVLMVRLIEGKYPNYQQLIPAKLGSSARVRREPFLASLKRVSLLANQKSKGITLHFGDNRVEISSNNPEMGDAKEEVEIQYEGKDIKIGFNAKYIQDVLASIDTEEVDLSLNDQLSPGMIRPNQDQSYTCVVMPMRI
jgi:DNA polymerase-3 subunit beta